MTLEIITIISYYNIFDILVSILLLSISIFFTIYLRHELNIDRNLTLIIYCVHHLSFLIYMFFIHKYGSDAQTFFINFSGTQFIDMQPGRIFLTKAVIFFDYINLHFYNVNYLFSLFSLYAFYLLLKIIEDLKIKDRSTLYMAFIFLCLPSIHFWHMGFSKDTLTFLCITIITYEILKLKTNLLVIFFTLVLLYFVRVHICLTVFISLVLFYLINIKNNYLRFFIIIITIFSVHFMLKIIFDFKGLASLINFLNIFKDQYLENPATAISSEMNFGIRMFYYLFAPNLFVIKDTSLFFLITAFENTIILLLFLKFLHFEILSFKKIKYFLFLFIFSLISLILLTYVTSNLGIAARQKWIFLPTIFIYLLASKHKKL